MPRTVEEIENAVVQLPEDQLRQFRVWYGKFDSGAWDEQIEKDISDGGLDALVEVAIVATKAGKTKRL
jgi:hypothetical protein